MVRKEQVEKVVDEEGCRSSNASVSALGEDSEGEKRRTGNVAGDKARSVEPEDVADVDVGVDSLNETGLRSSGRKVSVSRRMESAPTITIVGAIVTMQVTRARQLIPFQYL